MLRVLRRPDQLQHLSVLGRSLTCSPVALGEHARCEKTDVPAGHQNSDLRKQVCHIGLNRRRDLSLREDLCLFQPGGKATVRDIFKGKMVGVFGVPDMGPACSNKHVPNFLNNVDKLEAAGVDKVVCLAIAQPEEVSTWADKVGLTGSKIEVWADTKGAWTRMLGLDENQFDAPGPRSQRYAGLIDNGVLLKLLVEQSPGEVQESSAEELLGCIERLQALKSKKKGATGKQDVGTTAQAI